MHMEVGSEQAQARCPEDGLVRLVEGVALGPEAKGVATEVLRFLACWKVGADGKGENQSSSSGRNLPSFTVVYVLRYRKHIIIRCY